MAGRARSGHRANFERGHASKISKFTKLIYGEKLLINIDLKF
jgi:hypothetical protein